MALQQEPIWMVPAATCDTGVHTKFAELLRLQRSIERTGNTNGNQPRASSQGTYRYNRTRAVQRDDIRRRLLLMPQLHSDRPHERPAQLPRARNLPPSLFISWTSPLPFILRILGHEPARCAFVRSRNRFPSPESATRSSATMCSTAGSPSKRRRFPFQAPALTARTAL